MHAIYAVVAGARVGHAESMHSRVHFSLYHAHIDKDPIMRTCQIKIISSSLQS